MGTIIIGVLFALGASTAGLVGATTAWIRNTTARLKTGAGPVEDFATLKKIKRLRLLAGFVNVVCLIVLVLVLSSS